MDTKQAPEAGVFSAKGARTVAASVGLVGMGICGDGGSFS
jgi:hypothetical protein